MRKYAVYPGFVWSKNHFVFVGSRALMDLYDVPVEECVIINKPEDEYGLDLEGLVHLHPRHDGIYSLGEA